MFPEIDERIEFTASWTIFKSTMRLRLWRTGIGPIVVISYPCWVDGGPSTNNIASDLIPWLAKRLGISVDETLWLSHFFLGTSYKFANLQFVDEFWRADDEYPTDLLRELVGPEIDASCLWDREKIKSTAD